MRTELETKLAQLDRKWGRPVTVEDWRAIGHKAQVAPDLLTDDDLIVIEGFDPTSTARARRAQALAPPAPPPEPSPAPRPPAAHADTASKLVTVGYLKKIVTAHDEGIADAIATVIKAALTPVLDRIKALETAAGVRDAELQALRDQVLELRAAAAAREELVP